MKARIVTKHNPVAVIRGVESLPQRIVGAGARALKRGLLYAAGVAQREFLSGPRPAKLDVRTTRLRQSIVHSVDAATARGVIGRIGTNVIYARRHEFGFHGFENVKAHTRVISQQNKRGEEIDTRRQFLDRQGNAIGFRDSRKTASRDRQTGSVGVQFVKAHKRAINYKGRPFLAPALKKAGPVILGEIRKELAKVKGIQGDG